jgi:SpoVK/Ycf46/Vps4 family AAA+-type ATPase
MSGNGKLLRQLITITAGQILFVLAFRWVLKELDPNRGRKKEALALSEALLKRLGKKAQLSEYEQMVAVDVVDPDQVDVSWETVGGMADTIAKLKENVIMPFRHRSLQASCSKLLRAPTGILLYGPPGCGKTMLVKALAKESGCCFINLKASTFMDKWYGESQKLVDAVFSLAKKLEPCIIFIDEIDSFLRERMMTDHDSSSITKAQFMTLWDGFTNDGESMVIVVGATNRPQDIDKAIRRRMPLSFYVPLPNEQQRESILRVLLSKESLADDVDLKRLAVLTEGLPGSDLHELCRHAVMHAMREVMQAGDVDVSMRPLAGGDFQAALDALRMQSLQQMHMDDEALAY